MTIEGDLRDALELEEARTVGNSFGGVGDTFVFSMGPVHRVLAQGVTDYPNHPVSLAIRNLGVFFPASLLKAVLASAVRFAFLIELTNLTVTSTKTKTRWIAVGTAPRFAVGIDPRASTFDECYDIFVSTLNYAVNNANFRACVASLAGRRGEGTFPLTYVYSNATRLHISPNIQMANLTDLGWLLQAEQILAPVIGTLRVKKIQTKAYRTDRSQTGLSQTNRAKRWEASPIDYQYATVEECWSVERKLLERLAGFSNFPPAVLTSLQASGLLPQVVPPAFCPVTLLPLDFTTFLMNTAHGRSDVHVGHLQPLKNGGRHVAPNIDWVSQDGNRIQGDLSIHAAHQLVLGIAHRLN